ncbi:hypothetical protein EG339_23835 [Chryseobacterium bernardetii]|uniref:Uncharacterized protein n=1 Tax=Chryseobacterium bernardetii TaxID=1241978 RepID=A0A3G6TM74_9FLAO|nr:hypothetical protein [Chryseobacterium bernardetii]AZB27404.1 hypothetical protein EG339_23835 [Chryseobacterium bernardetii]
MKNKFTVNIAAAMSFTTVTLSAQDGRMGINTPDPKTTLDVSGKTDASGNLLITDKTGLQAPRLTRAELTAKGNTLYGTDQKGALVYITDVSGGDTADQRINITNTGYYFFDGSYWQKSGSGAYTAINGLNSNSNSIKLGGALIEPTTISGLTAINKLSITGTGVNAVNIANNTLSIDADNSRIGVGTATPGTKLDINNGNTPGAIKIVDGTQAEGRILVSDINGVGTWRNTTGSATIINSTTGVNTQLISSLRYIGASAVVTTPGYYIISPRLITDKSSNGCSQFIAYNLSQSTTSNLNPAFPVQDVHMPAGPGGFDFIYTSNIAYLNPGTYYMLVRTWGACTSNLTRNTFAENSFTLTLLK